MIKQGLLLILILILNGCVGTIRIAEESGISSKDLSTATHTKSSLTNP